MVYKAQSGHPGGSLSCIDILVSLYRGVMRFDPENPDWDDRDRFIMSKGHASPAVYSILRDLDVLTDQDLDGFRSLELIPEVLFGKLDNFALLSIPMFILMGAAIASTRAGADLYMRR